jgi:lon-related putative ATP-dependent protease
LRLEPDQLSRKCDPAALGFTTTEDVEPLRGAVGQPRALSAIEFGLDIEAPGYNIFAAGPIGTGKRSIVAQHLAETASTRPTPGDWAYLFNFAESDQPISVALPAGRGKGLARDMARFVEDARRDIRQAFESEDYDRSRRDLNEELGAKRQELLSELQSEAAERGFALNVTPVGVVTSPMIQGRPASKEEFERLSKPMQERLQAASKEIEERVADFVSRMRALDRETHERLRRLDRDVALFALDHLVDGLKSRYADVEPIKRWLDQVREDMVENLEQFRPSAADEEEELPAIVAGPLRRTRAEFFGRYDVNALVSHEEREGAPVIFEANPTYYNLFGRIDYQSVFGAVATDHRYIRAGAVHKANGGYLLIRALDVLSRPFVWEKLKEVLSTARLQPENMGAQYTLFPTATLNPEPIELDLKVVLVGSGLLYELLYRLDEDFRKLFKVKADFDVDMPWNDEEVGKYAAFISAQVRSEGLRHFDSGAVVRVVEFGARAASDQRRLSTRFFDTASLVTEASHWAAKSRSPLVRKKHVDRAVEEKIYRSNLFDERIRRLIDEGSLIVDLEGAAVGQVNGLSVIALGDLAFGRPVRITATAAAGHGEVIDIDRETELSGPIHDKGFLILAGFLQGRFGGEKPLTLSASLTFEQTYEEVEGDSASSAELYALLSSLAGAPVSQAIAVTGSVNQRGQVQAIGAVNEKVEGFFEVCKERGLTGEQGVIIPRANIRNLMLKDEVVQAVRRRRFNVWAVSTIDDGIELLTGIPAGERGPDGAYPPETVYRRVEDRLGKLAEAVREYVPHLDGSPDSAGRRKSGTHQRSSRLRR